MEIGVQTVKDRLFQQVDGFQDDYHEEEKKFKCLKTSHDLL
jgi:hypothetical protein